MFSHLLIPCQKHVNKKLYLYTEPLIQQYNCHEAKIVQIKENPIINIFNGCLPDDTSVITKFR